MAGPGPAGRMAIGRPGPEDVTHTIIDMDCLAVDLSILGVGWPVPFRPTSVA